MYRLADKLNLDDLKALALRDLRKKLSPENIVQELFSTVTAQHSEVLEMELAYFREHALSRRMLPALQGKLADVAAGSLPHADTVLIALFKTWTEEAEALKPPSAETPLDVSITNSLKSLGF